MRRKKVAAGLDGNFRIRFTYESLIYAFFQERN